MFTASRRIALLALLVLSLGLTACGGDDESEGSSGSSTSTEQATAAAETAATEATEEDPAAEAEKQEEIQALGAMQAFVDAADENDEAVFCGIATEELLNQFVKGLTLAQCVEGLKGRKFGKPLAGSKVLDVEVDDDVAAGRIQLANKKFIQVTLRKEGDRWLINRFVKPAGG